jgi:hypothetical protein
VPLYRQLLTGDEITKWKDGNCSGANRGTENCRWPLVRMGGQSTYQRSTLTINHGRYFLDTTVSADRQKGEDKQKGEDFTSIKPCSVVTAPDPCAPRSVNVFQGGQTYYVFFVFAKNETKQTYDIYVGENFDRTTVKFYRPRLLDMPIEVMREAGPLPIQWVNYKPGNPILTVTIDFAGREEYSFKDNAGRKKFPAGLCQPKRFCKKDAKNDGICACSLEEKDPMFKACASVCNEWAVKDLDYPQQGPLGFSFTLPPGFQAQDQGLKSRPDPQPYPTSAGAGDGKPNWDTKFSRTQLSPPDKVDKCYYSQLPLRDAKCGPSGQ